MFESPIRFSTSKFAGMDVNFIVIPDMELELKAIYD